MAVKKPAAKEPKAGNTIKEKLARIGVTREQDLVLHLPLRYEDHTRLSPLGTLRPGEAWQVEGTVFNTEIQYRGRRQLVCLLQEGEAQLVLRFFISIRASKSPGCWQARPRSGRFATGTLGWRWSIPVFTSSRPERHCRTA